MARSRSHTSIGDHSWVLKHLQKARRSNNSDWFEVRCPSHDDAHSSCGFNVKSGVFHCHACGWRAKVDDACQQFGWANESEKGSERGLISLPTLVHEYDDGTNKVVFKVKRFDLPGGQKRFEQWTNTADRGWVAEKAMKPPLYQLRRLLRDYSDVYWVEGEKCADYLISNGLTATTTAGGSNGLAGCDFGGVRRLRGRNVFVLADNDDAGAKYAAAVQRMCRGCGVVAIPVNLPGLTEKGDDVVDWVLKRGGSIDKLRDLAREAGAVNKDKLALAQTLEDLATELVDSEPSEVRAKALRCLSSLGNHRDIKVVSAADAIGEYAEALESGRANVSVFYTPWAEVNRALGIVEPQELWFLGGEPGFGKTAYAAQLCAYVAEDYGDTMLISQEMAARQLGKRLCALYYNKEPRQLTAVEARELQDRLRSMPMTIVDGKLDPDALAMQCRRWAAAAKAPKLIVVDYLQLIQRGFRDKELDFISALTPQLKGLAKELEVPILCLAQGSRSERREVIPTKSYFRGSSSIECDADRMLILWEDLEEKVELGAYDTMDKPVALYFVKQREGRCGVVRLRYAEPLTKFSDHRVLTQGCSHSKVISSHLAATEKIQWQDVDI